MMTLKNPYVIAATEKIDIDEQTESFDMTCLRYHVSIAITFYTSQKS